jgi:cell division protein FtsZ
MIDRRQFLIAVSGLVSTGALANRASVIESRGSQTLPATHSPTSESRVIRVLGVGGAGCNFVDRLRRDGPFGLDRIVAIGRGEERRPLDVRLDSGVDCPLSETDAAAIRSAVHGADTVYVVAGLGGATGTRVAPLVAREARAAGSVVVGFVTEPFGFEGKRSEVAARGARHMVAVSDRMIRFSNEEHARRSESALTVLALFDNANDEIAWRLREVISEAVGAI